MPPYATERHTNVKNIFLVNKKYGEQKHRFTSIISNTLKYDK